MKIWELETKNGRIFRVAIQNMNQQKRLMKKIKENESKSYEKFIRIEVVKNGIHDINDFEKLADTLQ
jgi:hypothetical protein